VDLQSLQPYLGNVDRISRPVMQRSMEAELPQIDNRLAYRWGALYGPAEIYDAAKGQLRIEIAGSGEVATFAFTGPGPARSLVLQGVTFPRAR